MTRAEREAVRAQLRDLRTDPLFTEQPTPEATAYLRRAYDHVFEGAPWEVGGEEEGGVTRDPLPMRPIPPFKPAPSSVQLQLGAPVGAGLKNDKYDVMAVKKLLARAGQYRFDLLRERSDAFGEHIESAIKNFQRDHDLPETGAILPMDPTIATLRRKLHPELAELMDQDARRRADRDGPAQAQASEEAVARANDMAALLDKRTPGEQSDDDAHETGKARETAAVDSAQTRTERDRDSAPDDSGRIRDWDGPGVMRKTPVYPEIEQQRREAAKREQNETLGDEADRKSDVRTVEMDHEDRQGVRTTEMHTAESGQIKDAESRSNKEKTDIRYSPHDDLEPWSSPTLQLAQARPNTPQSFDPTELQPNEIDGARLAFQKARSGADRLSDNDSMLALRYLSHTFIQRFKMDSKARLSTDEQQLAGEIYKRIGSSGQSELDRFMARSEQDFIRNLANDRVVLDVNARWADLARALSQSSTTAERTRAESALRAFMVHVVTQHARAFNYDVHVEFDSLPRGSSAVYRLGDRENKPNRIIIDLTQFIANQKDGAFLSLGRTLATLIHEGHHGFQDRLAMDLEKGKIKESDPEYVAATMISINRYVVVDGATDFRGYAASPAESHAFKVGARMAQDIVRQMQRSRNRTQPPGNR